MYRWCDRRTRRPRRTHKATAPRMKEMAANPNSAAITGVVVKLDGSPGTSEHRSDHVAVNSLFELFRGFGANENVG